MTLSTSLIFGSLLSASACAFQASVGPMQSRVLYTFKKPNLVETINPIVNYRSLVEKYTSLTRSSMPSKSRLFATKAEGDASTNDSKQNQLIVITGASSGIGFEATKRLSEKGNTIVLVCRSLENAHAAIEKLKDSPGTLIPAECDLSNLQSIRDFANEFSNLVDGKSIDVLCLNAGCAPGISQKEAIRTKDGFEMTVGTNHFGHFYLNHLLLPKVKQPGGRIVITASGVHDPESPGGAQGAKATLGDLIGLEQQGKACEMLDGQPYNPDKAYKDSKLCNVLFTLELQRRLDENDNTKGIIANCYSPGLIASTGLFRSQNQIFTKIFDFLTTTLFRVGETPAWGGGCLTYMTTVDTKGQYYNSPPGSSKYGDDAYGKQFCVGTVSKEAQDVNKARKLWELSEKELGIK